MPNSPARAREVNPDLIRCVALFFVLGIHFYTHCDIYNAGFTGAGAILSEFMRTSFTSCLALFLMLSGYFQRGRKLTARYYLGILRLLEMYIICAVLDLLYSHFWLGTELTVRSFLGSIVNFTASEYSWYILLYGGLFLMIPFLNLMYSALGCRGHKRILIVSFMALSCLPFSALNVFVNLCPYWWQRIWPIMFYLMGMYVGEYRPQPGAKKCGLWLLAVWSVFSLFNFFVYSPASPVALPYTQAFLYSHEGLQNAVLSPLIFLFVLNLDLSRCPVWLTRLMAVVSRYSYGAFLFSSITDSFIYGWLSALVPTAAQRLLFLPLTLPASYALAVALSAAADKLVTAVDRVLRPPVERLVTWAYRRLAPDAAE